jgi:hypothetical protein
MYLKRNFSPSDLKLKRLEKDETENLRQKQLEKVKEPSNSADEFRFCELCEKTSKEDNTSQ